MKKDETENNDSLCENANNEGVDKSLLSISDKIVNFIKPTKLTELIALILFLTTVLFGLIGYLMYLYQIGQCINYNINIFSIDNNGTYKIITYIGISVLVVLFMSIPLLVKKERFRTQIIIVAFLSSLSEEIMLIALQKPIIICLCAFFFNSMMTLGFLLLTKKIKWFKMVDIDNKFIIIPFAISTICFLVLNFTLFNFLNNLWRLPIIFIITAIFPVMLFSFSYFIMISGFSIPNVKVVNNKKRVVVLFLFVFIYLFSFMVIFFGNKSAEDKSSYDIIHYNCLVYVVVIETPDYYVCELQETINTKDNTMTVRSKTKKNFSKTDINIELETVSYKCIVK